MLAAVALLSCAAQQTSTATAVSPTVATAPTRAEPGVTALGSDISELPSRFPTGDWLTIQAPLLSMQLLVNVVVNGQIVPAVLDTGAMGTTISTPLAQRLGLLNSEAPGLPVRAIDAHGDVIFGEKVRLELLELGHRRYEHLSVTVLGDSPDLFLIGADVLQKVDLFIAADEGLVGVFAAGESPRRVGEAVLALRAGDRQLVVAGAAAGRSGPARFEFLLDTGAWNTSVPASTGINAGIPADLAYASTTIGVAGEQEARGRFVMTPLYLGTNDFAVGRVLAVASTMEAGEGPGLLGNDVLMRFHSIISFADAELRLLPLPTRAAHRLRGPGGAGCLKDGVPVPCVAVRLSSTTAIPADDDWPGVCLQIDVEPAYASSTVEIAITADDSQHISLFNGGAIRAFVSADASGAHHCFAIWPQLQRLGLTKTTPLSVRWLRTEGVRWPCDPLKTRCISFTGPLSRLAPVVSSNVPPR